MNGSRFLILVLMVVFAVPLLSAHILVNPVDEILTTSIINSQEVPFSDQELFDSNVPVLNVGLKKSYLLDITKSKQSVLIEKTDFNKHGYSEKHFGGVKRTNLRKH